MVKQLHWYDTLTFMDIKLIHKPGKNNVALTLWKIEYLETIAPCNYNSKVNSYTIIV